MTTTPPHDRSSQAFSRSFLVIIFVIVIAFGVLYLLFAPTDRYITFIGSGDSMQPIFQDGDEIVVDTKALPSQGDVIVFDCISCADLPNGETLAKRVYQINGNGCIWLTGDNTDVSYDSRVTGWLCPDEHIEVHGVVVQLNGQSY